MTLVLVAERDEEPKYRCDCPDCPCSVPVEKIGRPCDECRKGNGRRIWQ